MLVVFKAFGFISTVKWLYSIFIKGKGFHAIMDCVKCTKPAKISLKHLGGSLCASCFAEVIEKRVRKSLREHKWIKPKEKVLVIDDGTLKSKTGIYILKSVFSGLPFNMDYKKCSISSAGRLSKGYCKVVIPWSLDDEAEQFLDSLFNCRKIPETDQIKLLINISEKEIDFFAKIKKISGRRNPKTKLGRMLDELEKRYPGSKFGLLKAVSH